tara:strand:- start:119 stop:391 length:273 start_codon:yes stop_codon:yes gene_type:complete
MSRSICIVEFVSIDFLPFDFDFDFAGAKRRNIKKCVFLSSAAFKAGQKKGPQQADPFDHTLSITSKGSSTHRHGHASGYLDICFLSDFYL